MIASFEEIAEPFHRLAREVIWASVSTIDTKDRTRVRILHPFWVNGIGYVGTGRHGSMGRHLARNPHLSLSYVRLGYDPLSTEQAYADCEGEFDDTPEARQAFWALCLNTPEPLGFDPALAWGTMDNPSFGVVRLRPWRIEVASLGPRGWKQQIWRA